jgi:DNA-binding NarL/FixJ family response regulator
MMSVASDAAASLRDRPDTYDPTRLLVVDDHAAVRAGLTQLLEDQLDFEVVAAVAGAEAALSFAERECVDAAVVDYHLASATACW